MVKKYLIIFLFFFSATSAKSQVKDSCEEIITIIEKEPLYNGDLMDFIQKNIVYPDQAFKDSVQGIVYVIFWIDTLGYTTDHQVIRGIREDVDEEALRVSKLIKFDVPATQRGIPIKIKYHMPIKFVLSSEEKQINQKNRRCK